MMQQLGCGLGCVADNSILLQCKLAFAGLVYLLILDKPVEGTLMRACTRHDIRNVIERRKVFPGVLNEWK